MLKATWSRYRLNFRFTAITSRERMTRKDTYYIKVWDTSSPRRYGLGECALFKGLSCDDRPDYEERLSRFCHNPADALSSPDIAGWPSIRMGLETAMADFDNGGEGVIFKSPWTDGVGSIKINGLIWMGTASEMASRMEEKLKAGFDCIKIKIGGIDFSREIELLSLLRSIAPDIELRLDANGAFTPGEALKKLEILSRFNVHSIEQPIRAGQWDEMASLCRESPIPIALDEELIGINSTAEKQAMLEAINPAYIILKPTLTGGFKASEEWIELAKLRDVGWWATSALESNIGLNAIAQWVASLRPALPQGLGTGQLYDNNIPSPLRLKHDRLSFNKSATWQLPILNWN